jgi:translation initiation factor 4G
MLYDEEVVSDVTFMKWKTNHMEGEQIGRGIAIRTLTQFFKWLEEDTTS